MISRRRILSNSFSNRPALGFQQNSDSDVWYDTNTLFRVSITITIMRPVKYVKSDYDVLLNMS